MYMCLQTIHFEPYISGNGSLLNHFLTMLQRELNYYVTLVIGNRRSEGKQSDTEQSI